VRLWDVPARRLDRVLLGLHGRIRFLGFTRDGRRLIAAAEDGRVQVWAIDEQRLLDDAAGVHAWLDRATSTTVDEDGLVRTR
jgi:hypothetical protein